MLAIALAFAYATEARAIEWVSPWEIELVEHYGDCAQLCGNWSALYLSNGVCKGENMVTGETQHFCPDMDVVEAWTVDNEEGYAAMYHRVDELLMSERMIFERMAVERKMKLSVHPWQQFDLKKVRSLVERRRKQASATSVRCVGKPKKIGTKRTHYDGDKPEKVALEFQVRDGVKYISNFEIKYPSRNMKGGTPDEGAESIKRGLADCVSIVFTKANNLGVNALNFMTQGRETRLMGDDINESTVLVAPKGKCLGNMRMRYGDFVNRLCFMFNTDE